MIEEDHSMQRQRQDLYMLIGLSPPLEIGGEIKQSAGRHYSHTEKKRATNLSFLLFWACLTSVISPLLSFPAVTSPERSSFLLDKGYAFVIAIGCFLNTDSKAYSPSSAVRAAIYSRAASLAAATA